MWKFQARKEMHSATLNKKSGILKSLKVEVEIATSLSRSLGTNYKIIL